MEIEQSLRSEKAKDIGLLTGKGPTPPALTLLVVEEPENHLAPHLLGRTVGNLQRTARQHNAQVVLSSHTPSLLRRVEPEAIRHLRLVRSTHSTVVSELTLPDAADVAYKYVNEAVRAFPELYFSRFVVFGEGDSEEIILPRLLEAQISSTVDEAFVSVVRLGGRHANHFWRLLEQLQIPYATLLDLDRERSHGGIGQIRYAAEQLALLRDPPLEAEDEEGDVYEIDLEDLRSDDPGEATEWLPLLELFGIYFSSPLDLDLALLQAFPDAYQSAWDGEGPRIPDKKTKKASYRKRIKQAVVRVLGEEADGDSYTSAEKALFPWYSYLFLDRSKPVTHMQAVSAHSNSELADSVPEELSRLASYVSACLGSTPAESVPDALNAAEAGHEWERDGLYLGGVREEEEAEEDEEEEEEEKEEEEVDDSPWYDGVSLRDDDEDEEDEDEDEW